MVFLQVPILAKNKPEYKCCAGPSAEGWPEREYFPKMPGTCAICRHPQRLEIDSALFYFFVTTVEKFSVSIGSYSAIGERHLPVALAVAKVEHEAKIGEV
jgi:hypothetical protein